MSRLEIETNKEQEERFHGGGVPRIESNTEQEERFRGGGGGLDLQFSAGTYSISESLS